MRPQLSSLARHLGRLLQRARGPLRFLLLAAVTGGLFVFGIRYAFGLTLTVTTASDVVDGTTSSIAALIASPGADGKISLREAITAVNNNSGGPHTINFNIAGCSGSCVISPASALPALTTAATIDGTSQPGSSLIQIDGQSAGSADGLRINANSSTITGLIITRFAQNGLTINASSVTVTANYIGHDGTSAFANGQYGISITGSSNTIGSTTSSNRNVISGNTGDGVYVASGANNVIKGNYIGVNASGSALGNGGNGVTINSATATTVGGTAANTGNVIANNASGVYVGQNSAVSNAIEGNSIYGNTGLGIDVVNFTTNTGTKNSAQANYAMNYGVFTSASVSGSNLSVAGYVGSAANQSAFATSRVEIFKSDNDATGRGEGQTYIGSLTTDSQGNFSGTVTVPSTVTLFSGDKITATATDTLNNSSEFGTNFAITGTFYNLSGTVFEDMNYGGGAGRSVTSASGVGVNGARVELFNSGGTYLSAATTAGGGAYSFTGLPAGTYTVRVVNSTVASNRSGYTASLIGVQTYRTDASSGTAAAVIDRVGGETPSKTDAGNGSSTLAALSTGSVTPQSITTATIGAGNITGIDFGYSFTVVVNVKNSGQGSLRQFILNANALSNTGLAISGRSAGIDHAIFMISNGTAAAGLRSSQNYFTSGVARIQISSGMAVSDAAVIDGSTQPGFVAGAPGAPVIKLDGGGDVGASAITLSASGTTLNSLMIVRIDDNAITINGSNCTVTGSFIGTDGTGTLTNSGDGIVISSSNNTIGGATGAASNVIGGNSDGIQINAGTGNVVQGNYIGVTVGGAAIGNSNNGVYLNTGSLTTVGSTSAGYANVIANNGAGVRVNQDSAVKNAIVGNSIYANTGLGIDIYTAGVTPNNGVKNSSHANYLMDYPMFTSATVSGSTLTVTGFVGSAANQSTFASSRVEIFKSDGDPTGFGEGRYYLGFLSTDSQGNFSGNVTVPGSVSLANGDQITATATDTLNNTSEFGPNCLLPGANFSFSGTVFEDINYGGGAGRNAATAIAAGGSGRPSVRVELYNPDGTFRSSASTDSSGNYSFTNLPAGNYTVRVVDSTVTSARSGYTSAQLAVQTYRTDATAAAVIAVTDHVGGETPNLADAASNVSSATLASLTTGSVTPQSITTVGGYGSPLASVDFGFSFSTIVNTNANGQGSLVQFINNANVMSGAGLALSGRVAGLDNAIFMITNGSSSAGLRSGLNYFTSGVATITPTAHVPDITTAMVIDARIQPGYSSSPVVEVKGNSAGATTDGFVVTANGTTLAGLTIGGWTRYGIRTTSTGNTIAGNRLGTSAAGSAANANGDCALRVESTGSTIGGSTTSARNVIGGGSKNLCLYGGSNVVSGNYIGTNAAGSALLGSATFGIDIQGSNNQIGTDTSGAGTGNLMAGGASGTAITVTSGAGSTISGNTFNLKATGSTSVTGTVGVKVLSGAGAVTIGGTTSGAANTLVAFAAALQLQGGNTTVQGNRFGINVSGSATLPNGNAIEITSSNNTIGGTTSGVGNTIRNSNTSAGGNGRGVVIASGSGNAIEGNSIYNSSSIGIDLGNNGVTANDGVKSSGQPNLLMDAPVVSTAALAGNNLALNGFVGSAASQSTFAGSRVEFFISDKDASGYGEGKTYLGFLTADSSGNFSGTLDATGSGILSTDAITATATDASNNTSEFGANCTVTSGATVISGTVFEDLNYGGGNGRNRATAITGGGSLRSGARVELYSSGGAFVSTVTTDASGAYQFTGLSAGTYTVRVVNSTVSSSRTGYTSAQLPVQTFRTDDASGTVTDVYDHVGGETPALADAASNTTNATLASLTTGSATPQSITTVVLSASNATGVDFGFSFNGVVNTNNTGQGSLRQFLSNAAALDESTLAISGRTAGQDHAVFMISNGTTSAGLRASLNYFSAGAATITLASTLPQVTAGTVLDGQTQPGWTATPVIAITGAVSVGLDASSAANAGAIRIQGLSLYGMTGDGIRKQSNGDLAIRGCYIGLTPAGTVSGVGGYGINLTVSTADIGGTSAITRNVIVAATTAGIYADSAGGTIRGNYIGVLPDGSAASTKNGIGIITLGAGKTIGGSNAGEGNTISNSTSMGVEVVGATSNQTITGNFIGTDPTGVSARANARGIVVATVGGYATPTGTMTFTSNVISGNSGNGIDISAGSNYTITGNRIGVNAAGNAKLANAGVGIALQSVATVTIGGSSAALGNVIGGNTGAGISATAVSALVVQNNTIGINAAGTVALANSGNGIALAGATTGAQIGGTSTTLGNLISNNAKGVVVTAPAAQNLILGNSIFGNTALGIDLGDNGVTANDGAKSSNQANLLMDFPVFTSAAWDGTALRVRGYVGSAASQAAFASSRIEVFLTDNDGSGYGEGKTFVGATTADASGNFYAQLAPPNGVTISAGLKITGTATDSSNNTSEFAANFDVRNYSPFRNGSFESGTLGSMTTVGSDNAWVVPAASAAIDYWVVGGTALDVMPSTYWNAADGVRSLHLNDGGSGSSGSIAQTFDTDPGTTYSVFFDYAASAACGVTQRSVRVSAAGSTQDVTNYLIGGSGVIAPATGGNNHFGIYYATSLFRFTAAADLTTLTFQSLSSGNCGPVIDNVRVRAAADFGNGSFEQASVSPGASTALTAGDTRLTGWTISGDGINYVGSLWAAAGGSDSVALSRTTAGSLAQTFDTITDTTYRVSFSATHNPNASGGAPADFSVTAASSSQSFSMSYAGPAVAWKSQNAYFDATSDGSTLSFAGQTNTGYGAGIDAISVATAHPFVNGGFETFRFPARASTDLGIDDPLLRGWVTTAGSLQHWSNSTFAASEGGYSLSLNGASGPGTICQTFDVSNGVAYDFLFDAAANPALAADQTLRATVSNGATSLASTNVTLNPSGVLAGQTRWRTRSISFTATGSSATLCFASQSAGSLGLALDNVRIGVAGTLNTAGQFNAFETSTAANTILGVIKTKIAGQAFTLDIAAIKADRLGYSNSPMSAIKVELLNSSDDSAPLDEVTNCRASWTSLSTLTSSFALAGGDNGRKSATFTVNEARRNVRIKISWPGSGSATVAGCSNDNFAVRPASFAGFQATDNDDSTAGTARVLNNASATSGVVHRAGRPFSVLARAADANGNTLVTYDGTPTLTVASCVLPSGCFAGALSGSATSSSGVIAGNTFTYSEGGVISVTIADTTFADVDSGDSSQAERTIQSPAPVNIGRFVPDRYSLVLATAPLMAPATCGAGPSLQSFTFVGQAFAFGTAPAVSARPINASGNVLANARPRFGTAHVATTLVANSALTSLAGTATISSVSTSDTALVSYASGSFSFARGATPVASFAPTFTMTVNLADTTETGVSGNGAISAASALTIGPFGFTAGTGTLYYGRIYLRPAYGDLRSDLYLPLEAQSYSGVGWQPMPAAGTCVTAALTSFAYSEASGLLNNGSGGSNCVSRILANVTTVGGHASIRLPKPAANSVVPSAMTVTLDTGAAAGSSCDAAGASVAATSAAAAWLSNPDGTNPTTRVAWGRARSEFLNLRERFD